VTYNVFGGTFNRTQLQLVTYSQTLHVLVVFVQYGYVPYIIFLVLRHFLQTSHTLIYKLMEIIMLMINPLFGVFCGLGYITEVCCHYKIFSVYNTV